jgi:acetyl-CoA carboxylase biotin carboxyl carrier protein
MDLLKIKKLIDLLNTSHIGEIEVKSGDESVRISKTSLHGTSAAQVIHTPTVPLSTDTHTTHTPAPTHSGYEETSPMVGTIYLSSTPGAKPFVSIGDHISEGDTLCIIEAMKVFNPIVATTSGIVSARLVENAQPVEYDDVLFVITPDNT